VGKQDDIDKLDRAIKDAEIKLKSIQANIEQIDNEINALSPRKKELESNIEFHKRTSTIPIAQEYKKAKEELTKTNVRLTFITKGRIDASKAAKDVEDIIQKFKNDYHNLLKTGDNNVLRPKFGSKRGKK